MMQVRNIGALVGAALAAGFADVTAGGSGDATAVAGNIVDRFDLGTPQSAVLLFPFEAVLAEGETLSVTYTLESSGADDLSGAVTLVTDTVVVATGATGGGAVSGCHKIDQLISGAGRYVRLNYTPDLSAANTDTASIAAVTVFGGADRLPS